MANDKVIYTAMSAGYDDLRAPAVVDPDIDYIAYTDGSPHEVPAPWQARSLQRKGRNPRVSSRWYKILPHRHLGEYRLSLWIDANCELLGSFSRLFDELAGSAPLAVRRHPERRCSYDEAAVVKEFRLDHPEIVDIQMDYYRACGYPAQNGLVEANVLFREHDDPLVLAAMEDWWSQIETFSQRDQLSANYVFWKHGLAYDILPWSRAPNAWLRLHPHRQPSSRFESEDSGRPIDWLRRAAISGRRGSP